jgi:hypothetical protein
MSLESCFSLHGKKYGKLQITSKGGMLINNATSELTSVTENKDDQ